MIKKKFTALLAVLLILCPWQAQAASPQQRPALRLDVRSEKQAVLIISDPQMTAATKEIRYDVNIGGYLFRLSWEVEELSGIPGYGSVMYLEASDNSRVEMGGVTYPDGLHVTSVLHPDDTTLELWMDFSRPGLELHGDESPRDISDKLREIDFTAFSDEAEVQGYFDEQPGTSGRYTAQQYYSKRKLGLVYVLEPPGYGFDRMRDFGRCAGLTREEFDRLYWTPETDNYLITQSTTTHNYSYGSENYSGGADTYDLMWFDEKGLVLGWRTLFVFETEEGALANFRIVETNPNVNMNLERCIGTDAIGQDGEFCNLWIYGDEYIEQLRASKATKALLMSALTAETTIVENHDGEGRP